jgi:carbon monoxide dehydrogenase subunit G
MDLEHSFTVPVSVDTAWAEFQDIASVAECFPGASVTGVEGDSFHGSVKVKLGPIALVYNGSGTFTEKDDVNHRFVVDAKGKDKRGNGTAGATVTLSMDPNGDSTDVKVLTDLAITGKPAQFGRGVMQDVSDKLLGQFVACLEQRLGAGVDAPAPAPAPCSGPCSGTDGLRRARGARRPGGAGRARRPGRAGERTGGARHPAARGHTAPGDAGAIARLGRRARSRQDRAAGAGPDLLEAGGGRTRADRRDHLAHRALRTSSSRAGTGTPFTPGGSRGSRYAATTTTAPHPTTSCAM